MEEWSTVRFGDVVQKMNGKIDLEERLGHFVVKGGDIPRTIPENVNRTVFNEGYLGPAFHRTFEARDVLFATRFPNLNKVGRPSFKGICANTTLVLRSKSEKLLQDFIPYIMKSDEFVQHCILYTRGSTNPYINWTQLADFKFELPPTIEQEKIVEFITAASQLTKTLSGLKKSLEIAYYAYLENLHSFGVLNGFKLLDKFVDDDAPICYGILMPGKHFDGGVPVIKVRDFTGSGFNVDSLLHCDPEIEKKYHRSRLIKNDLLLSIRGTVGKLETISSSLDGSNITQDSARIRISDNSDRILIKHYLKSQSARRFISSRTVGNAVKGINIGDVRKIPIPIGVPLEILYLIEEIHKNFKRIERLLESAKDVYSSLKFQESVVL